MAMNLGHLAIFHAVAEERSVTRGADRLMVSQPAVSKQLRLLEKSLGVTLLQRSSRGVSLTEAGELLAGYARKIFALEAEAQSALQDLQHLGRGRLAIAASTTIGVYLLPELFVRFRTSCPGIETTLQVGSSRDVEQKVADGVADVGFIESAPTLGGIGAEQFATDELRAIARPDHPLARAKRPTPAMLCAADFVVRATGSETKSFVERALAERGLVVKPIMSLGTTEAIKRAVAAGVGVAIVSHLSIALEVQAKNLAVLNVPGLALRRPLFQIVRKGKNPSAALTAFLNSMRSELVDGGLPLA